MRVVVALAVQVGIAALWFQGGVEPAVGTIALLLAPAGYVFSYRGRHRPAVIAKVVIALGLLVALAQFLQSARGVLSVDAARLPLSTLFLWVQVLHAFDVPRRRDLGFSIASSTTLIAAAGALSLTSTFLWFLLVWAILAGAWLWTSARPRADAVTEPVATRRLASGARRRAPALRSIGAAGLVAALGSTAAFMLMPRLPATFVRTPTFSFGDHVPSAASSALDNPGLPAAGSDGVVDFASGGYPGFSSVMDLRARGQLSDEIAFRVRADQAALWRAEVFDTFDGSLWTSSDRNLTSLARSFDGDGSLIVPVEDLGAGERSHIGNRMLQTFYIDSPQPNVAFGAYQARTVYFPTASLQADRYGSMRSPILLDPGLVYSVISEVAAFSPDDLRAADPVLADDRAYGRYLQLPEELPARVRDLASRITTGAPTEYDRVIAVQTWLRANTVYDLNVPREPEGVDAVDHFLFETRRGFCEHIASAMAVLLRAEGIPTRLVTGYGPGSRNLLTGYFQVRQSDAHAWVEVYYPSLGWVEYDPTFGVPPADPSWSSRFVAPEVFAAISRAVGNVVPESVKHAVGVIGRGAVSAAGVALAWWRLVALVVLIGSAAFVWSRRRRGERASRRPQLRGAAAAFADLEDALEAAGHPRVPQNTPSDLLREIEADRALAPEIVRQTELVVRTFELERFAAARAKPRDADVMRARAAAARVRDLVAARER